MSIGGAGIKNPWGVPLITPQGFVFPIVASGDFKSSKGLGTYSGNECIYRWSKPGANLCEKWWQAFADKWIPAVNVRHLQPTRLSFVYRG
jgi:hypothetical protein